jgi:hypothetical protein
MAKYRKKPVIIEAIKFLNKSSYNEMCMVWGEDFADKSCYYFKPNCFSIENYDGWVNADDYVVKDMKGNFYPIKEEIFLKKYEIGFYLKKGKKLKHCSAYLLRKFRNYD